MQPIKSNVKHAVKQGVDKVGIQQPCTVVDKIVELSKTDEEALYNRRLGIEPLIGHIKQGCQFVN